MSDRLILCSNSPRRREMLAAVGYQFEVDAADIDENPVLDMRVKGEDARAHRAAQHIAEAKAEAVRERRARRAGSGSEVYLAADTIVVLDGEILGKPRDDADAKRMLRALAGRMHQVVTAFALRRGAGDERWETSSVLTDVLFKRASKAEIDAYVATGEPRDKAGAYAIQGIGGFLVREIRGSYSNVVGLPLVEVMRSLDELTDLRARPGRAA